MFHRQRVNQHFKSALSIFFFKQTDCFICTCGETISKLNTIYQLTRGMNRTGIQLKTPLTFFNERCISRVFSVFRFVRVLFAVGCRSIPVTADSVSSIAMRMVSNTINFCTLTDIYGFFFYMSLCCKYPQVIKAIF